MIDYLSCDNGKLQLWGVELKNGMQLDTFLDCVSSPKEVFDAIIKYGVQDRVLFSSSLDFADEYGFKDKKDAHRIWNKGYKMWKKKTTKLKK